MTIYTRTAIFVLLLAIALAACEQKGAPPAQVLATEAFVKHFGPAPVVERGTCVAFVIFFSSAREPGKVLPLPFFTFDETKVKKVAVERLLAGMEVGSYKEETRQPFAAGTRLLGLSEDGGTISVDFSQEILGIQANEAGQKALLNALTLTLTQFAGVSRVQLLVEGEASGLAREPLLPDPAAIVPPSPPRLLSVAAAKEKGEAEVEEVSAYFDRPVTIREIALTDAAGNPLEGELFQSVFDMAVVLKPKHPSRFQAGMPVKVRWAVTDKLGRSAQGEDELALEVQEH
ncbi:MAG: GerMN domain-containing protein [Desulfuromonadales bacterium]|nr:GerMN domain-containing protein [Desulfuromonadales bacterium]